MEAALISVIVVTLMVLIFVISVIVLTVVEANKSAEDDSESFGDPNDIPMSDIDDDIFDQNISLKYFQRGRSSLTELYMNSNPDACGNTQPIYTISLGDQQPRLSIKSTTVCKNILKLLLSCNFTF